VILIRQRVARDRAFLRRDRACFGLGVRTAEQLQLLLIVVVQTHTDVHISFEPMCLSPERAGCPLRLPITWSALYIRLMASPLFPRSSPPDSSASLVAFPPSGRSSAFSA